MPEFSGTVAEFQVSAGGMGVNAQVWDFEVRHRDEAGRVDQSVTVHMVAVTFNARLRTDEEVTIELPAKWREGLVVQPKRIWSRSRKIWIGAATPQWEKLLKPVAAVLAVGVILAAFTAVLKSFIWSSPRPVPHPVIDPGPAPNRLVIPSVRGLDGTVAFSKLVDAGFFPVGGSENSREVPFGKAIRTDPPAGAVAQHGASVTLYTSSGP